MAKRVGDVMHQGAEVVQPDDTVKHAAVLIEAHEVGALPVCDGERLVGILTDRDITVRTVAAGRDPSQTTAGGSWSCPVRANTLVKPLRGDSSIGPRSRRDSSCRRMSADAGGCRRPRSSGRSPFGCEAGSARTEA